MTTLLKRNAMLYFRDKVNLLLSLLAIFIIIALYGLFLGNVWGDDRIRALPEVDALRQSWLTAGILAVSAITTSMGAFGVIVDDRDKKMDKGFYASKIKRSHITSAYILNAFIVGVIMTIITAIPLSIFIIAIGGTALTFLSYVKAAGIILLASLSGTAMVCFIISMLKSRNASSTASTIMGTLIGFLMGIYLPIGTLPDAVQTAIKIFPPSHAASLLRQIFMEMPMQVTFEGVPTEYLEGFKEAMGVVYTFGEHVITPFVSIIYLIVSALIFYGLSLINMRRRKS